MIRQTYSTLVGISLAFLFLVGANVRADQKPIPARELNERGVLGSLGQPLGTVLTVEGIAASDNYRMRKADQGEILLRIQKVNGKALNKEVVFPFESPSFAGVKKPSVGTKFQYTGYETGKFTGIPAKALKIVTVQSTGYGFATSFQVYRDDHKRK